MKKQILFACDIDNTLLYSFHKKTDHCICVEWNHGQEQGYMTEKTIYDMFELSKRMTFLPVTTRSINQYLRIQWPDRFVPEYAIVSNGAFLLKHNQIQSSWNFQLQNEETKQACIRIVQQYQQDKRCTQCRMVDAIYAYISCYSEEMAKELLSEFSDVKALNVIQSFRKIYFLPHGLSKGRALQKFVKMNSFDKVYAAGDSCMDLEMLNEADFALIPVVYPQVDKLQVEFAQCNETTVFSEFICDYLKMKGCK